MITLYITHRAAAAKVRAVFRVPRSMRGHIPGFCLYPFRVLLLCATLVAPLRLASQIPVDTLRPNKDTTPARTDFSAVTIPDSAAVAAARSIAAALEMPLFVRGVGLITAQRIDRERMDELAGAPPAIPMMLRSVSAMLSRTQTFRRFGLLAPEFQLVNNNALPWSLNDGDLWAGRGANLHAAGGFYARAGILQIVVAPEFTSEANKYFQLHIPEIERPPIPVDRSQFAFPWYALGPYSIDMPTRFGERPLRRLSPGQSSILLSLGGVEIGLANENEWWGPGISNALVLSNNAPGFPHALLRTRRPVSTKLGELDLRWILGGLEESSFFDTTSTNNVRSLAAIGATIRTRWDPNLTFGFTRSVFAATSGWKGVPAKLFDAFAATGRPNNRPLSDSSLYPGGRDQVYSLFTRWVFPESGAEVYGEWGRTEFPSSLRDFLVAPNHTQAYTLGLQWRRTGFRERDFWRLQAENTSVEQSPTFRERPTGVWYTSRRVIQGYTNRGQPLGAAVGPGSSGQNIGLDYMAPASSLGLKAGRIRYNEDVRGISPIYEFKKWCNHDIDLYWGGRATGQSRFGFAAVDFTFGNRIQPWFQVQSGCPRGNAMVDIRNNTLSVTLAPFARR